MLTAVILLVIALLSKAQQPHRLLRQINKSEQHNNSEAYEQEPSAVFTHQNFERPDEEVLLPLQFPLSPVKDTQGLRDKDPELVLAKRCRWKLCGTGRFRFAEDSYY